MSNTGKILLFTGRKFGSHLRERFNQTWSFNQKNQEKSCPQAIIFSTFYQVFTSLVMQLYLAKKWSYFFRDWGQLTCSDIQDFVPVSLKPGGQFGGNPVFATF